MIIKRGGGIPSSEITDEKFYLRRREFIRLAGGVALSATAGPLLLGCSADTNDGDWGIGTANAAGPFGDGQTPLANVKPKVVTTDEKLNTFEEITSYNNFYEFGYRQGGPAAQRRAPEDQPVEGEDRRPRQQARRLLPRGPPQAAPARRADLPSPLR